MLNVTGPGGQPALGGAGCTLQAIDWLAAGGILQSGVNPSWVGGGLLRYGSLSTIPGGTALFDNGSGGATPNRGFVNANGIPFRRARNTVATNVPIDWVCNVDVTIPVVQPAANYNNPLGAWEVSTLMCLDAIPAAGITRDCGLVFMMTSTTSYANYMRAGVSAGNDYAGFGVVYNGTSGELLWICKKNGAGGGAPLTESVSLGVYGATTPTHVAVRFYGARVGVEARLEVYINSVLVLTRSWGTGTVLPVAADATFQAVMGFYKPMMRAAQASTDNAALLFTNFMVKAAPNAALLD